MHALHLPQAGMAELVDAPDSKSGARKGVWVRVPFPVLSNRRRAMAVDLSNKWRMTP